MPFNPEIYGEVSRAEAGKNETLGGGGGGGEGRALEEVC